MNCPKCGLINPDSAERCDCGYDFRRKTLSSEHRFLFPKAVTVIVVVTLVVSWAFLIGDMPSIGLDTTERTVRFVWGCLWTIAVLVCYALLKDGNYRALIPLALLTSPWGWFMFTYGRNLKFYCIHKQKH